MWTTHLFAIGGLAALCAAWVAVQRWIARADPELGARVESERGCGGCERSTATRGDQAGQAEGRSCSGKCER